VARGDGERIRRVPRSHAYALKRSTERVEATVMAVRPDPLRLDTVAASIVRARYRCTMCHKHCLVPCRFTIAEFQVLEQAVAEADRSPGVSGETDTDTPSHGNEDPVPRHP